MRAGKEACQNIAQNQRLIEFFAENSNDTGKYKDQSKIFDKRRKFGQCSNSFINISLNGYFCWKF